MLDLFAQTNPDDATAVMACAMVLGKIVAASADPPACLGVVVLQAVYQVLGEAGMLKGSVEVPTSWPV